MKIEAYAKINLGLDVTRKRPDGYHEVRMIMQSLRLHDTLDMEVTKRPGIVIETNMKYLPTDGRNLIYRACDTLMRRQDIHGGVHIVLDKVIPMAAGLAGGSADAAAALVGMNRLFDLGMSREELMRVGVSLGADIPFCLLGGTALAEGIGEKLTVMDPLPPCYVLLAKPDIRVSTKSVYEALDEARIVTRPDIDALLRLLRAGDLSGIGAALSNILENVTIKRYPVIEKIKRRMQDFGACGTLMSGSGPTVFGLFTQKRKGEEAFEEMKRSTLAKEIFLTTLPDAGQMYGEI